MAKEINVKKIESTIIEINKLIKEAQEAKLILGLMITEKSIEPEKRKAISINGIKNLKKHTREVFSLIKKIKEDENLIVINISSLV